MAVTSIPYARLTIPQSAFAELTQGVSDATGSRIVVVPDGVFERALEKALAQVLREADVGPAVLAEVRDRLKGGHT